MDEEQENIRKHSNQRTVLQGSDVTPIKCGIIGKIMSLDNEGGYEQRLPKRLRC